MKRLISIRTFVLFFSDKCFHCHGPDTHDSKGKFALKPGHLAKSEVWERIITADPDELMPPPD